MGYTTPERLRQRRSVGRFARYVLCGVGVLALVASFAPVWTGLGYVYFYDCFGGPCEPQFETRHGPDGRPRIVTKTTFWDSDVFHDLLGCLD